MSKYRRWAVLVSAGVLASACQLGLDERTCSLSDSGEAGVCMEGWSCCADSVCRRDCSGVPEEPSGDDGPGEMNAIASSMELTLGDTGYRYSCAGGGRSSLSAIGDNGGMGPSFSTQNTSANNPECPWPATAPGLWLDVLFRNFLESEGLATGTWDLADPESILALRVRFIASVERELPVGQEAPYQYYDSTTPSAGAERPLPEVTYQGFQQSPLASGTVTVSGLSTGYSGSPEYWVELSNVTLAATDERLPNPEDPFPPTLSIAHATLIYAF